MHASIRSCHVTAFVFGTIGLFLVSCRGSDGTARREIDLGQEVGILEISLDTSFGALHHWIHTSDYSCGKELVWGSSHSTWPFLKDTAYFTLPPDSLFHFMVRLSPFSPADCDSALNVHQWLTSQLTGLQMEYSGSITHCLVVQGTTKLGDTEWAFLQTHHGSPSQNDIFEAFTEHRGRGLLLRWQRVATSAANLDFGMYCRRQFETSRLKK